LSGFRPRRYFGRRKPIGCWLDAAEMTVTQVIVKPPAKRGSKRKASNQDRALAPEAATLSPLRAQVETMEERAAAFGVSPGSDGGTRTHDLSIMSRR